MDGIAVLSLLVSAVVAIWGIYQTRVTSRLEVQVHRLTVDLDQTVQRLYRAKELVTVLQSEFHKLFAMSHEVNPRLTTDDIEYLQHTLETMVASGALIDVAKSELFALTGVIGDPELIKTCIQFQGLQLASPLEMNADDMGQEMQKLRETSIQAFSRIYKMLALATTDKPDELWFMKPEKRAD